MSLFEVFKLRLPRVFLCWPAFIFSAEYKKFTLNFYPLNHLSLLDWGCMVLKYHGFLQDKWCASLVKKQKNNQYLYLLRCAIRGHQFNFYICFLLAWGWIFHFYVCVAWARPALMSVVIHLIANTWYVMCDCPSIIEE